MEGHQVIPRDLVDGGVLRLAGVNAVGAVDQLGILPHGDAAGIVVPAGDVAAGRDLLQVDLVLAERRMHQHIGQNGQTRIDVLFQHRHRGAAGAVADIGLDGGGDLLQLLVDLVAGLGGRAARAHHGTREIGQTDLVGRFINRARPNHRRDMDQRQLVIFQHEQLHPVRQGQTLHIGNLDVAPASGTSVACRPARSWAARPARHRRGGDLPSRGRLGHSDSDPARTATHISTSAIRIIIIFFISGLLLSARAGGGLDDDQPCGSLS